ncbi:hypothetical protein ACP4OV_008701 [Aristida adscensionis]
MSAANSGRGSGRAMSGLSSSARGGGGGGGGSVGGGSASGGQGRKNPQLPLAPCEMCGSMVVELVSQTAAHPGRVFYRCSGNQCGFFKWQDEYAVWLVEQGYLWHGGEEIEMVKTSVDNLNVHMDHVRTSLSRMCNTLMEMHED